MADINLERKDTTMWPWVVGLLALALVIWGVWAATDGRDGDLAFDDPDGTTPPAAETDEWGQDQDQMASAPESVRDFLNECAVGVAPGQTGQPGQTGENGQTQAAQQDTDPDLPGQSDTGQEPAEYAEECIDQMITAMEDVVEDDDQIESEIDRLRERAEALGAEDSESPQYSTHVQEVLTSAANVLQQIQQARPGAQEVQSEVQEAQRAADEIQPDVPIAQQTDGLSRFFQRAGTAMQMMGEE